jgi:NADP-dependent aldehyde dehydrogenase
MIKQTVTQAKKAYELFINSTGEVRSQLLNQIASEIEALGDKLIETAMQESNLPQARLQGERGRTCGQLRMFADVAKQYKYAGLSIDTAIPNRTPAPKPDIRKMQIGLGPLVVFGASNFPLAFSTAGGDTASALAAGCPVIIKAHPYHQKTSTLVFRAITKAIEAVGAPKHLVQHLVGLDFDEVKELVIHPQVKGVAFTGSFEGGTAIYKYTVERQDPIPVFCEMGSTNPMVFLGDGLASSYEDQAKNIAGAITMGAGQFCTNPGLIFGVKSSSFDGFIEVLRSEIKAIPDAKMLHGGIRKNYLKKLEISLSQKGVSLLVEKEHSENEIFATAFVATVAGATFMANPNLAEEVFGPYSLVVQLDNKSQLEEVLSQMQGQLSITLIGTNDELQDSSSIVNIAIQKTGRVLFNGVPTGVEVCHSMVHGGAYPSTTDARFTSVGAESILRWQRPVCYQNFPDHLLPLPLRNENLLGLYRMIDGQLSNKSL